MRFLRTGGLLALILLLALSIASCGGSKNASQETPTEANESSSAAEQTTPAESTDSAAQTNGASDQTSGSGASTNELPILAPEIEGANANTSYQSRVSTSWLLDFMGEDDGPVMPLEGTKLTIGFLPERYGGDAGCNFYSGVYSQDGLNVTLESPATTGSLCEDDPDLLRQENTFMSLLATTSTYDIVDGKLKFFSSEGQQLLTFSPVNPVEIEGTVWKLRFISSETQWEEAIPGTVVTFTLNGNDFSGNAGCNDYAGTAEVTNDGYLKVDASTVTDSSCDEPEGAMNQEQLYMDNLTQASLLRFFPASFELLDKDGMPLLILSADWQDAMEQ